jgi:hypothetical protein
VCVDEENSGKQNAPASIQRILKCEALTLATITRFLLGASRSVRDGFSSGRVCMGSIKASLRHARNALMVHLRMEIKFLSIDERFFAFQQYYYQCETLY